MTSVRNKIILSAASAFFIVFFISIPAFFARAQGELSRSGVKISPALFQEKVEPGLTLSSELKVTNISAYSQIFYLQKINVTGLNEQGQPIFSNSTGPENYGLESWIKIPEEPITILGGETKAVPFSIEVPASASPGGHFGAIFVAAKAEKPSQTGTGVGFEVASLINLSIAGNILEETQIREFRTDKAVYNAPDVKFIVRTENLGNTLSRPMGFVEIRDMFGKQAAQIGINETGGGVFPKSVRQFEAAWQGKDFAFGRYQATLSLVYGDEGIQTVTSVLSFWVLPVKPIALFLGGLTGLLLAIFVSVKLYIRRKLRGTLVATGKVLQAVPMQKLKPSSFSRLVAASSLMLGITIVLLLALFFFFS